ncbi:MAG TPA: sigma-70 family RNA polymerase sigma factor [Thermoanaerobaculia bacterium]|nr:sigma-70 family RNA polymerase sigma factor [Thermoanaerobaculia bacterium]
MDVEELFLRHLGTIERIVVYIGRSNHLDCSDIEDLGAQVKLELIEGNYAIIRKFEGRSCFATYLTTVIQRMFYQHRVKLWGKWRPSAEARRLGDKAIALERLMFRDGLTFHEAVETMTTGCFATCTVAELETIHSRLPARQPRPVLVAGDLVPENVANDEDTEGRALEQERAQIARAVAAVLDRCLTDADAEDQIILRMRFWNARRVPDIARVMQLDQRKVYKRIEKLLGRMRHALIAGGVSRADVDQILTRNDQEIRLKSGENLASGPSHRTSEGVRENGESRIVR